MGKKKDKGKSDKKKGQKNQEPQVTGGKKSKKKK